MIKMAITFLFLHPKDKGWLWSQEVGKQKGNIRFYFLISMQPWRTIFLKVSTDFTKVWDGVILISCNTTLSGIQNNNEDYSSLRGYWIWRIKNVSIALKLVSLHRAPNTNSRSVSLTLKCQIVCGMNNEKRDLGVLSEYNLYICPKSEVRCLIKQNQPLHLCINGFFCIDPNFREKIIIKAMTARDPAFLWPI